MIRHGGIVNRSNSFLTRISNGRNPKPLFGSLLQRRVTDKLAIGGEIFHQTPL